MDLNSETYEKDKLSERFVIIKSQVSDIEHLFVPIPKFVTVKMFKNMTLEGKKHR